MAKRWLPMTALLCSSVVMMAESAELTGYYKNLLIQSEAVVGGSSSYWWDINRVRLDFTQDWQKVEANIVYDHEIQTGSYLDTTQFRQLAERDDPRYWELQGNTIDRGDVYGRHELYRGTLKLELEQMDLRFGRQQINWATAVIWNPMDRFNPLNPLQLERDERQGVDALLLDINVDELSRLSVAYAPQQDTHAMAARYRSNIGGLDWSLMAGDFSDERKMGGSFAGQLGLVGVRSELVFSDPDQSKPYLEWVLGLDYTFYNGISVMLEGYFNGDGERDPASYNFASVINGEKLAVGRHYLGGRVAKEVTALLNIEMLVIRNLEDQSHFFHPSVNYALPGFDDLYLNVGAQLFVGKQQDEYGLFKNIYYGELQFYF